MSLAPKRPCARPGCPNLVDKGYCPECQKKVDKNYERTRETAVARGYTHRWQKVRKWKLSRDPLCQPCQKEGRVTQAFMVHHADGNSRNNRSENLVSVCRECHEKIHGPERWKGKGGKNP